MAAMLVVTTDEVPGYRIRSVLGEVVGVTARTHNPFSEGVKGMDGKPNPNLGIALLRWREDAVANMIAAAAERGANAIVGMRFDNRWITQLVSEICAYGTAVQVSMIVEEPPPVPAAPAAPPPAAPPAPPVPDGPPGRHARPDDESAASPAAAPASPAPPSAPTSPAPSSPAPESPAPTSPAPASPAPGAPTSPAPGTGTPEPPGANPAPQARRKPQPTPR